MVINNTLTPQSLTTKLQRFWQLSAKKIVDIEKNYDTAKGSPVFTVQGKYTTRGWTEWTQGFQYGSAILQYDATGDERFLKSAKERVVRVMSPHINHIGVHDHGFNNVSTYGNLLRLMVEGKMPYNEWEKHFYELALKISGCVQAARWTKTADGGGFIYSFNGPHSLFVDTIRSCRSLMVSYKLGQVFQAENDKKINLLERALLHIKATAKYSVFYGEGRDTYDAWGRTAHESIFNTNDGNFRCPNSQQGYTGFTTWTRGLSWAMCGFAEELEFLDTLPDIALADAGGSEVTAIYFTAARATCDFFIKNTPVDGVPYWDTGAPNLYKLGDYINRNAEPFNDYEPVDSSAAAIGAQGLLRLGNYLIKKGDEETGKKYWQAGLTVLNTLLDEPYLSTDEEHQGLLLHTIYHQPNAWDYVHPGQKVANCESCMWGDYHIREAALYIQRIIDGGKYYAFYNCVG